MEEAILACYELATTCLPGLVVATVFLRRAHLRPTCRELAGTAVFIAYIAAVLHVTGAGTLSDGMRRGMPHFDQCNLVPFADMAELPQYLLNVALFVPFGCFIGAASNSRRTAVFAECPTDGRRRAVARFARTALGGFAFSLVIEASQLLTNRVFDVDDLIMNTLGAGIGCAAALAYGRIGRPAARWRGRQIAASNLIPEMRRTNAGVCAERSGSEREGTFASAGGPGFEREEAFASAESGRASATVMLAGSGRPSATAMLAGSRRPSATAILVGIAAAVFLGRFLLFDEMGAAAMLYGF